MRNFSDREFKEVLENEDPYYTDDIICRIVSEIRTNYPDCAITLSIGEKSRDSYQAYYEAGADRYLLRHETAQCRGCLERRVETAGYRIVTDRGDVKRNKSSLL